MKILISLAAVLLATGHPAARADDAKALIGVWKGGMPGEPHGSIELTITPGKITGRNSRNGKNLGEGTYELDPVKKTSTPTAPKKADAGPNIRASTRWRATLLNGSPPAVERSAPPISSTGRRGINTS